MSVEGPFSSVQKISPRKKPPKSKLASILDGQVNDVTFLLNNLPCRLSVLPDGRHWRPTLTVAKNDDRHWRPSMTVVKNDARQWRPSLSGVTVGRHWRLVCRGLNIFLPHDAMRKRGLCCLRVFVRLSVRLSNHDGVLYSQGWRYRPNSFSA